MGDLHGQLTDLLYILDASGPPSETNKFCFNGDFVDRGHASTQVTLILFALQLAAPEHIFLNRGNHEEASICCIFGFMKGTAVTELEVNECDRPQPTDQFLIFHPTECLAAYDELTFSMFVEVFRYLPLATIIDSQVRAHRIVRSAYVGPTLLVFQKSLRSFKISKVVLTRARTGTKGRRKLANAYIRASAHIYTHNHVRRHTRTYLMLL